MNREHEERLIQGYLDRILTPQEVEELDRLLVSDAEFRRDFVEATRHDSFLEGSLKELSSAGAAPPRRESSGDSSKNLSVRPPTRRRLAKHSPGNPSAWTPILIAAGVFFAILIVAGIAGSGSKAPRPERPPVARPAPERQKPTEDPPAPTRVENERRLAEAEARRKELEAKPVPPDLRPSEEAKRQDDLARARQIEEEMRRKVDESRPKPTTPPVAPPERPQPAPERPKPPQEEKREATQVAIAKVEWLEGDVSLLGQTGKRIFSGTEDLLPGQGVETGGTKGRAAVKFSDGTRVELGAGTEIAEIRVDGGKRVVLAKGTVTADVAKQPKGEFMLFATPHSEAKVLGTTLRLRVDPDPKKGTYLDVVEGKVELKRKLDGLAVEVPSGHYAVAAAGASLEARRSLDEIVLFARDGRIKGSDDWKKVPDPDAFTGMALSAPRAWTSDVSVAAMKQGTLGYVEFTFDAELNQEYTAWIRVKVGSIPDMSHDAVSLEIVNGTFIDRCGFFRGQGIPDAHLYTAYFQEKGYWWGAILETPPGSAPNPNMAVRVKFTGPEKPTLKLYPCEGPLRVDAIWLTRSAGRRPSADHPIPAAAAKVKSK